MNKKEEGMKSPIIYYGGKTNMLKHILPLLPKDHHIFVEPFFGGGAVFFAKKPSKVEVINDILNSAINFFEVCQDPDQFRGVTKLIKETLHSEMHYRRADSIIKGTPSDFSPVLRAWAFFVAINMSFAYKFGGGFAFKKDQISATTANKIDRFDESICTRLRHVQIFCRDALDVIRRFDGEDTFFYLDPPYANSSCGAYAKGKNVYYELLKMLPTLKGKWLLSSYPAPELEKLWELEGINRQCVEKPLSVSGKKTGGKIKIETLTWNYEL